MSRFFPISFRLADQLMGKKKLDNVTMFFPSTGNGPDIAAMGAIIGAGISYLVSRSRQIRFYNGVDLESEDGWKRLEDVIDAMIQGLFAGSAT